MFKELKEDIFLFKLFALVVSIVGGIYILQLLWGIVGYFSDILLFLVLAWVLSFVLEPAAERLIKLGLSRTFASIVIYIILALFIGFFVLLVLPIIASQIKIITDNLPEYLSALSISENWSLRIQEMATSLLSNSLVVISSVASFLFSFFVVLFLSFYFLVERQKILSALGRFVPYQFKDELRFVSWAVSSSFATFIRVQVLFGAISGVVTWLVLIIFGINFALSAGVLSGIFTVIPVIGPILAIIPPLIAGASKGMDVVFGVFIVLVVLQFVEFNVLGPKIWGSILKIHPAVIFLSFLIGYKVAGGWGSVFSIPVVAVLFIVGEPLVRHFLEKRKI